MKLRFRDALKLQANIKINVMKQISIDFSIKLSRLKIVQEEKRKQPMLM